MKNSKGVQGVLVVFVLFFITGIANAGLANPSFFGREHGWPRLVDNGTKIRNKIINNYNGKTSLFKAKNRFNNNGMGKDPYFKVGPAVPRAFIDDPSFSTWAYIRDNNGTLEILDGLFEVYGALNLNGSLYDGLAFSASLIDVDWDQHTIAFKMEADQQGYLCDLGFCSFSQELLTFNLYDKLFDGNFGQNFDLKGQTVATVPVPAAFWLFGTAILGLVVRRPKTAVS